MCSSERTSSSRENVLDNHGTEHESPSAMAIDPIADTLLMPSQHENQPAQSSSSVPSFSINIYTGLEIAPIDDPNIDLSKNLPTNNPSSSTESPTAPLSQGEFQGRNSTPLAAPSTPYQKDFDGEQKPQLAPSSSAPHQPTGKLSLKGPVFERDLYFIRKQASIK